MQSKLFKKLIDNKITKVDFGWTVFEIKFEKKLSVDGEECYGNSDFDKKEIVLEEDLPPGRDREILLHEITHIVLETMGLGSGLKSKDNESLTYQISRGFTLLYNLNKELVKTIYDND